MKNSRWISALLFLASTLSGAQIVDARQSADVTGVWLATDVTYAPWIFDFRQSGSTLTGTVRQSGAVTTVAEIVNGIVQGSAITFELNRVAGGGAITFKGTRNGETIIFTRSSEINGGAGDGLFGPSGPSRATASRQPSSAQHPAAASNAPATTATAQSGQVLNYRGMFIDVSSIQSAANRDVIIDSLRRQIEIVDDAVMKPEQKAFLKSIRVTISSSFSGADDGTYNRANGVTLSAGVFDREKPVLLHELMHGYHDQKVVDEFRNAEILRFYQQARDGKQFPTGSYMLSNPGEYFAMMTSVYLHGSAARDPFLRGAIKEKQPDFYKWAEQEFGER